MELTKVSYDVSESIATITLNHPESLNVLDDVMQVDLMKCLDACEYDPEVRVVVLQAAGRAFSGGGDIKAMLGELEKPGYNPKLDEFFAWPGHLAKKIRAIRKPVVCAMQGPVAGAAANITLFCDFRIAADDLVFLEAFIKIGLITDGGGVYVLNKLIGAARTTELVMSGRPVEAEEAHRIGLVTEVVPVAEVHERARKFAKKLAGGPPKAYEYMKTLINQAAFSDLAGNLELEAEFQRICGATEDFIEGSKAFVEKRRAVYQGK